MELEKRSGMNGFLAGLAACLIGLACGDLQAQAARGGLPEDAPFTVVLDAGHGGHDPGNLGNGFLEKDIALKIVLQAGKILKGTGEVKVLYTREDDTFVDLFKRGEIANKAKADLFVSVHCDSHSSDANGAGTFVLGLHANKQNFEVAKKENSVIYLEDNYEARYADYNINSPESVIGLTIMQEEFLDQSILLGKLVQDRFTGQLKRKDRKVKQAGFIVLHQTFMPSVLIETGFLTNRDEGRYLNSAKGQQEMGQAIADAILDYKRQVRGNSTPLTAGLPKETPEQPMETKPEPKDEGVVPEQKPVAAGAEKAPEKEVPQEAGQPVTGAGETRATPADPAPDKATPVAATGKEGARFKVQLMAVTGDVSLNPADYKGLSPLSKEPVGKMHRVLYGDTPSYEEARRLQAMARQKGYAQAYVVAYLNGERVAVEKALESLAN
jgi:N-acetylmuramoyl-L-alanine amidase